MIWLFLGLTAVAVMAILVPLSRRPGLAAGGEAAVYRDQIAEIERDRVRGTIGDAEAEAARTEVARRLLAATDTPQPAVRDSRFRRRLVAVAALTLLPLAGIAVYGTFGSPGLPDQPLAARSDGKSPLQDLVARVEAELARRPEDGQGWDVIAPVYLRMGQAQKAVEAFRNAIRLLGSTAEREAGLGEALVVAANGQVTPEAKAAFERVLALDPGQVRPRFYLARAAEQAGQDGEASAAYRKLLADAPEGAPYVNLIRDALAQLALGEEGQGPTIDPGALESVAPEDRIATIRGMVDGLAVRLKDEPRDLGGQLRLIRAWTMLGERDRAREAANAARAVFDGDQDAQRRISDLMLALGLEGKPA